MVVLRSRARAAIQRVVLGCIGHLVIICQDGILSCPTLVYLTWSLTFFVRHVRLIIPNTVCILLLH